MRNRLAGSLILLALAAIACGATAQPLTPTVAATSGAASSAVTDAGNAYDPSADPARDLAAAVVKAQAENKRILVEVGGDWCVWCHIMDQFYVDNPELLSLRQASYVLVKVNYSQENQNEAFLSKYPQIPGYPHIFIMDSDGKLLHSQDTSELEQGESYNLDKFTAFLKQWSPQ